MLSENATLNYVALSCQSQRYSTLEALLLSYKKGIGQNIILSLKI